MKMLYTAVSQKLRKAKAKHGQNELKKLKNS